MGTEPLTQSEQDLLGQMARFTERRAVNGVYLNQGYSKSLGVPVLFLCALGEQALALQQIIMGNAVKDDLIQLPDSAARNFITGENNGGG
jgi:hypothetical protein